MTFKLIESVTQAQHDRSDQRDSGRLPSTDRTLTQAEARTEYPQHGAAHSAAASKGKGKRKKAGRKSAAARRKITNKVAQQRYRWRRKVDAIEHQEKAAGLEAKSLELDSVRASIQELKFANAGLQAELQLPALHRATAALEEHQRVEPAQQYSMIGVEQYDAVEAKLIAVRRELTAVLQEAGLPLHTATADSVAEDLQARLAPALQRACSLQGQAAFTMTFQKGPLVICRQAAPSRSLHGSVGVETCEQASFCERRMVWRERWYRIMQSLHLSTEQQVLLLFARRKVLERLPALYAARTDLAASAMAALCPPASAWAGLPSPLISSIDSKMRTAHTLGIGPMQVKAGETTQAMNKLHDNLHQDFMMLMQLQNLILLEVLTPVQAAVLHVQAGRDPMESMAFCNFVAAEYGPSCGANSSGKPALPDSGSLCTASAASAQPGSAEATQLARQHIHSTVAAAALPG